ncbi:zinc-ribbon domain-containing protein [Rhodococcus sp. LB1]|uniref:zinc-ribbon domain-containing protein n=1 Tax=Rhodococcus sp. LB1 TaxID=1807499 RepID=UPI003FA70312
MPGGVLRGDRPGFGGVAGGLDRFLPVVGPGDHTSTPFVPEWICATNPGHTWQAPLSRRSNGAECPDCREAGKSRVELAHHAAAEELFGNARSGWP